jgi:uncharacterized repeat protein (TIGR02543 family)
MNCKVNIKIWILTFFTLLFVIKAKANEGAVHKITYQSTTQNTACNMNVYLPFGYNTESDSLNYYPVFYLIHGGGENYMHWVNSGNAKTTLDTYIASGKAVPMIMVMPDAKNLSPEIFYNELINDIIPYIEKTYRVKTDKDNRGVGGLSWGGLQAMEAGIYHYELFGYLSVLSSGWFTSDNAAYTRARNFLSSHGEEMENSIRYLYFGQGTSSDMAYENGQATLKVLREAGLTVHYWEKAGGHTWAAWKEDLKSFLPNLFRDSTTKYVSLEFQGGRITTATIMTNIGSVVAEPDIPTRNGHSFLGWFKEPACVNRFDFENDTIKKSITLFAKWDINKYNVSFNSNGGNENFETLITEHGSVIKAPAEPTKQGFIFDGWYTSEAFNKKWNFTSDKVTQNLSLIAKWIDETLVAVKDLHKKDIAVFPNPASSVIQIMNLPSRATVSIYNTDGRLMAQHDVDQASEIVSIEQLPEGFYLAKIKCEDFEINQKVVIRR